MTEAKLIQNPVNPNLEAFRKEMRLINVTVYPDMLVYKLPTPKRRESCIPDALALINKMGLPLEALRPGSNPSMGNTFIVKPKTLNNESNNHSRSDRTDIAAATDHRNDRIEPQNPAEMKKAPVILFCIACICGILSIINLYGCGYPAADTVHPQYTVGEKLDIDNITLPGTGYTPPLTVTKVYMDINQNWYYDATDKRDTPFYHLIQYQLKRYRGN